MAQTRKIIWSPIAVDDFNASVDFILLIWNETIASSFIESVETKITLISNAPFIGSASVYLSGCRKTLISPYHALIYRVHDDAIEIVRLFDMRQNIEKLSKD